MLVIDKRLERALDTSNHSNAMILAAPMIACVNKYFITI